MIKIVLDTNILVSALWTPAGNASAIVNLIFTDKMVPCFDNHIINEYRSVLHRPRLSYSQGQVDKLLKEIIDRGYSVTVTPSVVEMPDESDRKFYDTAVFCSAFLITGNIKHFPKDPLIITPSGFLEKFKNSL